MRFWDSSAIVPLVVEEAATVQMQTVYREDPVIFAWWGTAVECTSALSRLEREGELDAAAAGAAIKRLRALQRRWQEVQPLETLRDMALRLLRVHPLRAADSFSTRCRDHGERESPGVTRFRLSRCAFVYCGATRRFQRYRRVTVFAPAPTLIYTARRSRPGESIACCDGCVREQCFCVPAVLAERRFW